MVFPNQELWYASLWCGCSDAVPAGQWLRQHHGSQLGWQRKQNKSKQRIRNNERDYFALRIRIGRSWLYGITITCRFQIKVAL
ncbi:hypothetical protein ACN38_g1822 [Penicillium nordicum]|uniref:Uncharacterized protein n=1 Tax=Penicillium nordicum TaxID=229535 RepID=A0A0M8P8A6_9EURO|nr:hypothetical protein ACN38_g1822 [Penicillium nordicum]